MRQRQRIKAFDWSTAVVAALALSAAALVYYRHGRDRFLEVLGLDLGLLGMMLPKVLAGCFIGALVTVLLPREIIARWVGAESGYLGLVIAFLAGIIFPGGPFTIFPVAGAFLVVGADIGAAVAFITAWSLLGYSRALVWELPFFGFDFVVWRVLVAIPLPLLAGLLARIAATWLTAEERQP
jgi:uncharacterized membrane protein YraQ (UPF0718 family)